MLFRSSKRPLTPQEARTTSNETDIGRIGFAVTGENPVPAMERKGFCAEVCSRAPQPERPTRVDLRPRRGQESHRMPRWKFAVTGDENFFTEI